MYTEWIAALHLGDQLDELSCGAIASGTVSRDPVPSMLSVQTMFVMR